MSDFCEMARGHLRLYIVIRTHYKAVLFSFYAGVPAAVAWTTWEASTLTLLPDDDLVQAMTDPRAATAFARIENHYFLHRGFFDEGQLIANVDAIRGIPAVIVQGRYDVCTPPMTAWDLHRAWPEAEFVMVPDAGHAASEPGIARALRDAADRFVAEG